MIRVAQFIGSLTIGGAENQVSLLANALDPQYYESHIITLNECAGGFRGTLEKGVRYYCLDYRRRNAPLALMRLYRYLKMHRIDVLHCHMYHAATKGALIGGLCGVPVILVSEHGKNSWKNAWHRLVERKLVSRLTALRVAVSDDIRRIRIEQDGVPADSVIVMANAVNTAVTLADNAARPRRLGSLGRLVDAKDFTMLFRAVRLLIDRGYDIGLEIAGDGAERKLLEQAVQELELQEVVALPGVRNAHEFLSGIDVFVMSSKHEGMPVALLEAMAHGLPIAATTVGGIPEVIEDGKEGLLSPVGDPLALADNIARLIDDQALRIRLGKNAQDKVRACYGIERVSMDWQALYRDLLQKRSQGL